MYARKDLRKNKGFPAVFLFFLRLCFYGNVKKCIFVPVMCIY